MKKVTMPIRYGRLVHEGLYILLFLTLIVIWIVDLRYIKENNSLKSTEVEEEIVEQPATEIIETHILTDDELSLLYFCNDEPICDTCLAISQEDALMLMKIAVVEDNTNAESQAYVMETVLNRVKSPDFPSTIEGVIRQKGQFSTVSNGSYDKAVPDANSHLALAMVEGRQIQTDALYFESAQAKGTWQSTHLVYVQTIGGTKYYEVP